MIKLAIVCAVLLAVAVSAPAWAETGLPKDTLTSSDGEIVIHPIHHATFVVEWNGTTVYVDPVGGAEAFAAYQRPDLILITHVHGDHTSADTVAGTSTDSTTIVAPKTVAEILGEVRGEIELVAPGGSLETDGIGIEAIPAYNLTENRLAFHPRDRGDNAYVVTLGGTRIFISGDTEGVPEMRALEKIDAAFVCMNLPYTMDVDQAADAVLDFAPTVVYPYHFRGKDGMSDLDRFTELVAADPAIEVRRLTWY